MAVIAFIVPKIKTKILKLLKLPFLGLEQLLLMATPILFKYEYKVVPSSFNMYVE